MATKATPIEQLPNVQMSTERESFNNPYPVQPPIAPNQGGREQISPPGSATQMADYIDGQQQAERMVSQEQYRQRQFVPQYPPSHDPYSGQGPPVPQHMNPPMDAPMYRTDNQMDYYEQQEPPFEQQMRQPSEKGYLQSLLGDSKCLFLVFVLLFFVQMAGTQSIFRKLAGMIKIPETMIFTGAKIISAATLTAVFFLVKKNVC